MMEDTDFLTPESFIGNVEALMRDKGINHIEAVLLFCDDHGIDVEEVIPLITRPLKEKIKVDAMENGMFKKEAALPL